LAYGVRVAILHPIDEGVVLQKAHLGKSASYRRPQPHLFLVSSTLPDLFLTDLQLLAVSKIALIVVP